MSVVPFRKPMTPARKAKEQALRLEYIEYHRWRALINREIKAQIGKGVSFKTMSARTGLCVSTISNMVYKPTAFPRMDTMYRILKYLGYRLYVTKA